MTIGLQRKKRNCQPKRELMLTVCAINRISYRRCTIDQKSEPFLRFRCRPTVQSYHNSLLERTTRSPAVAEKADRTAYGALINRHLDNKTNSPVFIAT